MACGTAKQHSQKTCSVPLLHWKRLLGCMGQQQLAENICLHASILAHVCLPQITRQPLGVQGTAKLPKIRVLAVNTTFGEVTTDRWAVRTITQAQPAARVRAVTMMCYRNSRATLLSETHGKTLSTRTGACGLLEDTHGVVCLASRAVPAVR